MPVDYAPDPGGNLVRKMVAQGDWRIRVLDPGEVPPPDVLRWTSHYVTCPDADRFRARRGKNTPPQPTTPPPAPLQVVPTTGTLLAVDGNSLAHRAYYGYQPSRMATPDGRPIWAVHGFLTLLALIIDKTEPDALVIGFDDPSGSSVRRDIYPDYKAGRAEKAPDLYSQMDEITEVLRQLGVQVVTPEGLEADDVLASASAAAEAAGWQCVIATSDRDSFGLISGQTTVLRLMDSLDNAVRMTPAALLEQKGVRPDQYLDYAALVGDKSDNLPGVQGYGEKFAAKLLGALGSVAAARENRAALVAAVGPALAAKLTTEAAAAALERNWSLMTMRRDIPIDVHACRPATTTDTVATVLRERHLPKLVDRLTLALCPPPPAPARRDHLGTIPDVLAELGATAIPTPTIEEDPTHDQPAPPLVRADPPPVCPGCGKECAAALPLAQVDGERRPSLTGETILVEHDHPLGDLVAVLVDDVWAVRRIPVRETPRRPENRRRSHACVVYPYTCMVPECGKPARLYATGTWCDEDVPPTPAPYHSGEPARPL
ncbi:5'-3' exonuclease H3TH domain-containing protein [Micromonospora sp. NPDC049230]|uniref:5'-3' exonuclease n=1 Tax=Micromonospora sp. NPDC049230 TaxID=3155502 RepID=UPI0033D5BBF9